MKRSIFTVIFCLCVGFVFGQTVGDYRTRDAGNWNQTGKWQVFFNGAWRNIVNVSSGPYFHVIPSNSSGEITINHDITITVSVSVNQLVVSNGVRLTINANKALTVVEDFTQTPILVNTTGVLMNFGTLNLQALTTTTCQINGILASKGIIQISNPARLIFNSGSSYRHANNSGGNIPLATWNINSTCRVVGLTNPNALPPNNLAQAFGNFTWDTPGMGATSSFSLNGGLQTVNGNLTFVTTGNTPRTVRFDNGGAGYNLTVGGNLTILNGSIQLTQNQTSTTSVTVAGNVIMSAGTLTLGTLNNSAIDILLTGNFQKTGGIITRGTGTGSGTIHFDGGVQTYTNNAAITSAINFTVENGSSITLGQAFATKGSLTIDGTFATANNALSIGRNLTVGNTGTFQPGASLVTFDGSLSQAITSPASLSFSNVVVNQAPATSISFSPGTIVAIQNSLSVNSASTLNVGTNQLTLQSSASGTAYVGPLPAGASIIGSVIVQRHLPNSAAIRAYRYLASPVVGSFVSDWQTEIAITGTFSNPTTGPGIDSNSPSMFRYDETFTTGGPLLEDRFRRYPASGSSTVAPLNNAQGYAVYVRNTADIVFDTRGTLKQGSASVPVTNSGGANGGWNLLGNPYPAPIDWDDIAPDLVGVDNAIYFTDNTNNGGGGGNVSYVNGVGVPASFTGIIAQGQGFWVHTATGGTVNFQETDKEPGQAQFLREGDVMNLLRISMNGQSLSDEMALRLHSEATDAFDAKYDALKFSGPSFSLASITQNNEKLAINAFSSLDCDKTIALVIEGAEKGNFTMDFTGVETFDTEVKLYLKDKVENKTIELANAAQYAFVVNDISALKNRFEIIFDRPEIETTLAVIGESICEDSELAHVTIKNTQNNVKYTAQWNGQNISGEMLGNGGDIQIPISVENLPQSEEGITINAQMSCSSSLLVNKAIISVLMKGKIESVKDGTVCKSGTAVLKATAVGAERYNWYEDLHDTNPIAAAVSAEFTTPVLTKSKTYYVAAANAMGCEGDRVAVKANVANLEDVTLMVEGTTLISSYDTGNQWFLDGEPLENETAKQLEALISGTYSVEASIDGCTTTAAREIMVEGIGETSAYRRISIYPNPTTDKVVVDVTSANSDVTARLLSSVGVELNTITLKGEQEIKSGEFDLIAFPVGMYMIRIQDGQKVFTKKISKIK